MLLSKVSHKFKKNDNVRCLQHRVRNDYSISLNIKFLQNGNLTHVLNSCDLESSDDPALEERLTMTVNNL